MKSDFLASVHKDYQAFIKIATDAELAAFIRAQICESNGENLPELTGMAKALYETHGALLERLEDASRKKSQSGRMGGNPNFKQAEVKQDEAPLNQCLSNGKAPLKQTEAPLKPVTDTVSISVTDTTTDTVILEEATASSGDDPASGEAADTPPNPVPYKKIMELYNATCIRLRQIKTIDGKRKTAVEARFKTHGLDGFINLFEKANASNFLCGNGSKNWMADFDWLMSATNMAKVLEGKYDNDQYQQAPPQNNSTQEKSDPFLNNARRAMENAQRADDG